MTDHPTPDPAELQAMQTHFAHCIQVLGGTTAAARRLDIDERAIRRFINGERPLSAGLLRDTAKALRQMIDDATAAEAQITARIC
jgi:DNA-binding transcriptional regulator YdaS (Cro superfamily)